MTNEGSAAAARAVGMDVSKTTPAASTTGRRGRRNYCAVYGAKFRSPELALVGRVGQQRHVTSALQRDGEATLMPGAGTGHPARQNLAALAHEAPQPRYLFVIDQVDLFRAEVADLLVRLAVTLISRWWHELLTTAPQNGMSSGSTSRAGSSPRLAPVGTAASAGSAAAAAAAGCDWLRGSRNWISVALTSVVLRFCPSWPSHDRVCSRPSI